MTLHGPHQVAKQSRTIRVSLVAMAESKSALLETKSVCASLFSSAADAVLTP